MLIGNFLQIQNARSRPHSHQRKAAPMLPVRQVILTRRKSQDPLAIAFRRKALRLPRARMPQGLLELERPLQAHQDAPGRKTIPVQDTRLPQAIHRSEQLEETRQDIQAFCR